jgi:hypothetical protein
MNTRQHLDLLTEALVTLRHARVFISSREKMHPTGIGLYDQLVKDIEFALASPGPALASALSDATQP